MRFAEHGLRATIALAAALAATGCATVADLKEKVMPSSAVPPPASAATPGAAASAPAAARAPAVADVTPLNPATQRAFDDANRALRAGRTADAERGYRALIQSNPELGGPHANLGLMYRKAGKLNESAAELEQAVKLNPKQPLYLNQLGITYRQLGRFDKARDAYERALALDADYAAATLNLGILNDLYAGDAKRAGELYERYLQLTPAGDPVVTKWIAELKNRKSAPAAADRKEKT
jgi:tetratricopeptide (TPR) repeat protein